MSNTRRAADNSVLHQNRFASSPEFERGLLANLVAKRTSILENKADRDLVWFVQYLSHQEGGLAAVATDLLRKYPERPGTKAMVGIGKGAGKKYTADEVRQIRPDLPRTFRRRFKLRGETNAELRALGSRYHRLAEEAERARILQEDVMNAVRGDNKSEEVFRSARAAAAAEEETRDRKEAAKYPASYPVTAFLDLCHEAAKGERSDYDGATQSLEKELSALCLDPAWKLDSGRPWYFANLIATLRDYQRQWVEAKSAAVVVTELGSVVQETLDYAAHSKSMTLVEGDARTGKTFSARSWCEQHPGHARYVEVPTGNDDKTFFRALARGLGLGNFQQYKALEIRERVECVLLTGDVLICLDEGHRLWPEINLTRGFPRRINWVMSMANQNVPICIVATPQFVERQIAARQFAGWNDAQFIGRLGHRERLPSELSVKDLVAVAKSVLPEADAATLRVLAAYARTSARYLAAIDTISKRARYIAGRAGRPHATAADVRCAMKESVIPSDTMLVRALEKTTLHRRKIGRSEEFPQPTPDPEPVQETHPGSNRLPGENRLPGRSLEPSIATALCPA